MPHADSPPPAVHEDDDSDFLALLKEARQTGPKPRLYRENFTAAECAELDQAETFSAVSELSLLRVLIARVLRALRRLKATTAHHLKNLIAFSQVSVTMASLARVQFKRSDPPPDAFLSALDALEPSDL